MFFSLPISRPILDELNEPLMIHKEGLDKKLVHLLFLLMFEILILKSLQLYTKKE